MAVDDFRIRHPEGADLQRDVTRADWIAPRLLPWGRDVGTRVCAVVPTGYAKYVRVFHHIETPVGDGWERWRWADVARRTGRIMHPTVQFTRFRWLHRPDEGELDRTEATVLTDVLRDHTSTPADCWLAIWHGYGELTGAVAFLSAATRGPRGWVARLGKRRQRIEPPLGLAGAPTISLPGREYYLYRGSIDVVPRFEFIPGSLQTPNMWWPQDRAWFVGTEIDFDSTLVACSARCANALLASNLEALEVLPEDRLDVAGDMMNPPEGQPT